MRSKAIVNGKGEVQAARIEIPIEGNGGALGMQAVRNLTALISGLKDMKTEQDIVAHFHVICGFTACCQQCGFITEKNADDLMHMAAHLTNNEIARAEAAEKGGQS